MKSQRTDLSIFSKFNFDSKPVGVKFLLGKPEGIKKLDKQMPLCQMIKEAHLQGAPFYATVDNEDCFGRVPMGWVDTPPFGEAGYVGEELEIFQEARANSRIYVHAPKLSRGVVNYIVFSPFDQLTFEPDLLFVLATPSQAEIVMRAMTYSTGEIYESKSANVLACAWLFTYPFQTGKVNFVTTGLGFGTKARQIFAEGQILISIPFDWIPTIANNLKEMKWVLPSYTDGKDKFPLRAQKVHEDLAKKYMNP